jgi:hypothetical protein
MSFKIRCQETGKLFRQKSKGGARDDELTGQSAPTVRCIKSKRAALNLNAV